MPAVNCMSQRIFLRRQLIQAYLALFRRVVGAGLGKELNLPGASPILFGFILFEQYDATSDWKRFSRVINPRG